VIQIFTIDGNLLRVLERGRIGRGTYTYTWDGTNGAGNPVARGIYFIRVVGPTSTRSER
jgi:flagellar hook assembly protein FlgD